MRIVHFCAGLEGWNGMANTARQFVAEELARGDESRLTNDVGVVERTERIDRVHIHGTWLPVLWKVAKLTKRKGAELIVRPCGNYDPIRIRRGAIKRLKKWLVGPFEHAMLNRADFVQCTCAAEAEWVKAYHPSAKVELTDLRRFFRLDGEEGLGRRSRSTVDDSLHVLYLGRRHPLKGVEFLERAVGEIRRKEKGEGRKCGVELRVVSNHFGEELEKDWAWCDVLVLPTLSENFGRVVAEALERGKRVVTTDGAPAWGEGLELRVGSGGVEELRVGSGGVEELRVGSEIWSGYEGRLIYLKGYRDGTDEERVELLKRAIERICK